MRKCNISFQSRYARVEGVTPIINVDEFRSGIYPSVIPRCVPHSHELILVNGTKNRPHFRHKHSADLEGYHMTQWHVEWQSNFPFTEVQFLRKDGQLRDRRADVVLPDSKKIIEIQHSQITSGEVTERIRDYGFHNHTVTWILDAQNSILVKRLGGRYVLEFASNRWLYENFLECNDVYYDINGFIYKVNPKLIRSHQIDVQEPVMKSEFIESLKTNTELWGNEEPPQCYLHLKQQGAGSGKTYGMMQLLNCDPEIANYRYITFITKQHAAVNVMYREFMNQYEGKLLSNIELLEEPVYANKKHIVRYTHKLTGVEGVAIFATVDSFTYALGEAPVNARDQFIGIVKSIRDEAPRTTREGGMTYAGVNPILNKEMLIMIDETQDLSTLYGEAFLNIVRSKYTNLCVVGDRLQSLGTQENALTFLYNACELGLKVIKSEISNEVRRFSDPALLAFVNSMIPFEKYSLPPMTATVSSSAKEGALQFINARTKVYANSATDDESVVKSIDEIMSYFNKEVVENNRTPEDFMIVTPFTGKNPLIEALQITLNIYWKNMMEDVTYIESIKSKHPYWASVNTNEYRRYAVFHKSEESGSINLNDSEFATRIVSIHSSKGDGRKVVFVIGVTHSSLQKFSQVANNLCYDSLLHVAITRQKERLYFRLENNGDEICSRIMKSNPEIIISSTGFDSLSKNVKLSTLSQQIHMTSFEELYETVVCKSLPPTLPTNSGEKMLIDMGDHNIRFASMLINTIVHCCNHELRTGSATKRQFFAILNNVKNAVIQPVVGLKEYWKVLANNKKEDRKGLFIPVVHFTVNKTDIDYKRYFVIILHTMGRIVHELSSLYKSQMNYFCPLESIILYYMIECIQNGTYLNITIDDIYNVIDMYSKSFDSSLSGHDQCECKKHFSVNITALSESEKRYNDYLRSHYDGLIQLTRTLDKFDEAHPQVNWLYSHHVNIHGGNTEKSVDEFSIYKHYQMIGYDETSVYVFTIKPQFNQLNYNEFLTNSILDTYLISSTDRASSNYERFNGKSILSCAISLNSDEVYTVDWTIPVKENSIFIKNKLFDAMKRRFEVGHSHYHNSFLNIITANSEQKPELILAIFLTKCAEKKCIPEYINSLWNYMKTAIDLCDKQKQKRKELEKYTDKDTFISLLDRLLIGSLKKYIDIEDDDSDSE